MNSNNYVHDAIFKAVRCGERILWSGSPRQGIVFRGPDILIVPFSLVWGATAILNEISVLQSRAATTGMILWGMPFVVLGVYMMTGRFFLDSARRAKTHYAVTDQRVLIVSDFLRHRETSLPLKSFRQISFSAGANGGGTITFGEMEFFRAMLSSAENPAASRVPPNFELSEGAREVYELIRHTQRGEITEFERATSRAA